MLKTSFGFICERLSSASAAERRSIGVMIDHHNRVARAASKPTLLGGGNGLNVFLLSNFT